jgi:DNA modification methylase
MQEFLNRVIHGDCSEIMAFMPSESVDLTVTSPPYDNLRSYNGYSFPFEEVAKHLYRVTKQGGIVVWVVGDATIKGDETGTSFKQALYFKEIGFNLHDTMIYQKASQPRQNKAKRYEQQFEYMFVFSKGKPNTFNMLTVPSKNAGKKVNRTCRDGGKDELQKSSSIVAENKRRDNIWFYGSKKNETGHPAIFPEQLAEDHIISWSNEGDTVLDCFCGSGTTLKMAHANNRNFIGIDYSEEYVELSRKRLELAK